MAHPHEREFELFEAALELPSGQREAFLAKASGGDPDLLKRVRKLLRAAENGPDFLTPITPNPAPTLPAIEKPGTASAATSCCNKSAKAAAASCIWPNRRSRFAAAWRLKVIKLGMDTQQVIARFEAERQALALMDHPNIAKVLDAGATDTGRPYFVMELVRGIRITDYCDENKLSTQKRLESVHPGLPGHPARAPKRHHSPRYQTLEHPRDRQRRRGRAQGD